MRASHLHAPSAPYEGSDDRAGPDTLTARTTRPKTTLPASSTLRVLVAEDDRSVRDLLVGILTDDGYAVHPVASGTEALSAVQEFRPDLVLLDAGLPGLDGWAVARRVREADDVPIIFVTGADAREDIRAGFDLGGDDYIVKPFDAQELSSRVRAVLRRSARNVPEVWEIGGMVVDTGRRTVTRSGSDVALTSIEFDLLEALVRNRPRVVSKQQLLSRVWGYGEGEFDDHVVEVHVSALRGKLEAHGPRIIHTVRGAGYALRPPGS